MDLAKFFIIWGPTFLFVFIVLIGILIGCLRGFRKSLILFIHMIFAGLFCLILYLCLINNSNLDTNVVGFTNSILKNFGGQSLQDLLKVDPSCQTLHQILTELILRNGKIQEDTLQYYMIIENIAYINTLVDMAYHIVFAILCFMLYGFLIFLLYLIYLIFYPIRRKINRENYRYHKGEINHPYRRKRALGSLIGGIRSTITAVIGFSFLGSLIFVVTGGANMPNRDQLKEDTVVEFNDPNFNKIYDYYSYVCQMGDTGIFKVLNGIKDTNQTPFYFYFADLVLQGKIEDEALGVANEKFYLRDELGEYMNFMNQTFAILLKYADVEIINDSFESGDKEELTNVLLLTMQNEGFVLEFNQLIDEFESKSFMNNLCLSALTSLVNHIDLVAGENKELVGVVNQLFKGEEAIKVSDLATGTDIKNLFKGLVSVIATIELDQPVALEESEENNKKLISTKQTILIAQKLLPTIQNLSLFTSRKEVGNQVIKGLYTYCSTNLIEQNLTFDIPDDLNWIDEFNILLNACNPLLTIGYEIYSEGKEEMIQNLATIFEGEHRLQMEKAFDDLSEQLIESKILDVVFKSSFVGNYIDQMVVSITNNEDAKIPKDISYVGKEGECGILIQTLKTILQHGGGSVLLGMMESKEEQQSETIVNMIDMLTNPIEETGASITILDKMMESKLLYYFVSTYLSYAEFGAFKLYIPEASVVIITEGQGETLQTYRIINQTEIKLITNLLSNCKDLIIDMIDNPGNLDYVKILTNSYIRNTIDKSALLQGTLANVVIGIAETEDVIILPESFDSPEQWLSQSNKQGETALLIDAIYSMANGNEELINDLLNGKMKPSALLNLENSILEKLCVSKILRYTISDMITTLGTNDFTIVVARSSIEELNAKTTKEKNVNVVKANELSEIFIDIKTIIDFDENDDVKINYRAVFENKAEISKNKTITATLVQTMLKYTDSGFLVIPKQYEIDFEKIKTEYDLTNNVWFGSSASTEDDELYLMLSAVETLIDKDENGRVPEDFDLSELQYNLKLKKNGIDMICTSAILNASISKQVVEIFDVSVELYKDDTIEKTEFNLFFDAIFTMFNRDEIIVDELNDDLFNLQFRLNSIDTIIASEILLGTISQKLLAQQELNIPQAQTSPITYVGNKENLIINRQEMKSFLRAMFAIVNDDVIAVNFVDTQFNSIALDSTDVGIILNSSILQATVSSKIVDNQGLVIPMTTIERTELVDTTTILMIKQGELKSLFNAMFVLFETDTILINELGSAFESFGLSKDKMRSLLKSTILQATLSKNFLNVQELIVPDNTIEDIITVKDEREKRIAELELEAFFNAIFVTTNSEISGTNFNIDQMVLPTTYEEASLMTSSLIVSATLSDKIMVEDSIVIIPDEVMVKYELLLSSSTESYILQQELTNLILALTNGMGKTSISNLSFDNIVIPKQMASKQALVESLIIRATISKKILNQDTVYIEKEAISLDKSKHYQGREIGILSGEEILNIIRGIELLNPNNDETFDNLVLDVGDIIRMNNKAEVLDAIANSDIYRAIISRTLGEPYNLPVFGETKAYQMFVTTSSTADIMVDGVMQTYVYAPAIHSNYYVIQYPEEKTEVYTSFTLEEDREFVCAKRDILALQHLSST